MICDKETKIPNCDTLSPHRLLNVSVSPGLCPLRPERPGRVGAKESEPAPAPSLAALALIEAKRFGLSRNFLVFLTLGTETQLQQQEQISRTILQITQLRVWIKPVIITLFTSHQLITDHSNGHVMH